MEQSTFILLLGIVLGCVVASGIWAILWALIKGDSRLDKDRLVIMQEIASLCAEIDVVISRNTSKINLTSFVEKLKGKFTVSMPLLNVYYVKYIESLISRYEQASEKLIVFNTRNCPQNKPPQRLNCLWKTPGLFKCSSPRLILT